MYIEDLDNEDVKELLQKTASITIQPSTFSALFQPILTGFDRRKELLAEPISAYLTARAEMSFGVQRLWQPIFDEILDRCRLSWWQCFSFAKKRRYALLQQCVARRHYRSAREVQSGEGDHTSVGLAFDGWRIGYDVFFQPYLQTAEDPNDLTKTWLQPNLDGLQFSYMILKALKEHWYRLPPKASVRLPIQEYLAICDRTQQANLEEDFIPKLATAILDRVAIMKENDRLLREFTTQYLKSRPWTRSTSLDTILPYVGLKQLLTPLPPLPVCPLPPADPYLGAHVSCSD